MLDFEWHYCYHRNELGLLARDLLAQLINRLRNEKFPGNLDFIVIVELTLDFLAQSDRVRAMLEAQ